MGTDWFGRDVLARVLVGGRTSLAVALAAVALGGALGALVGGVAGYYGGLADEIGMRATDFLIAFPALLLALLLAAVLGPGPLGVTIAIGTFNVPYFARIVRSAVLTLREQEYVLAARAVGTGDSRILWRHILPNLASPLLVQVTVSLSAALLSEAALSYLGLGTQPPQPSWGRMLKEAQSYFALSPWPAVFPGLFLALTVLGLNLLGDGLRDLLDPRLRRLTPWRQP
jgi:peptide/nickel transport system permease protein